mmetsp:Transcript_11446/g.29035  ORF Transcript_11446/g.29035 Transcript_11446/m.29035 type:complete len:220 (-) Transcript_11446:55-714(-)
MRTGVGHVVQDVVRVEVEPLRDLLQALGPEGALRVDVEGLALAAALLQGQLARHAQGVAELRLAAAVLAVNLRDGPGLQPALQDGVHLLAPRVDHDLRRLVLRDHRRCRETHRNHRPSDGLELLDFVLADAFDFAELLLALVREALHGVHAPFDELLDVAGRNALALKLLNGDGPRELEVLHALLHLRDARVFQLTPLRHRRHCDSWFGGWSVLLRSLH